MRRPDRAAMIAWQRERLRRADSIEARAAAEWQLEITRASEELLPAALAGDVADHSQHRARVAELMAMQTERAMRALGRAPIFRSETVWRRRAEPDPADEFIRIARQYLMLEVIRRRIAAIAETTRAAVVAAVTAGAARGLGTDAIAQGIRAAIPGASRTRAHIIARTETHGAGNHASQAIARQTGLRLGKVWIAAEDERTRSTHAAADERYSRDPIGMDDRFDIGGASLQYPGDPAGPPHETINCRCAVGHVVLGM